VTYGCVKIKENELAPRSTARPGAGLPRHVPPAQGIERKRKALEQDTDNFSSFRAMTTRARRTARRTGGRPLREGGADWSLAWPIGRSGGVCSQAFPRWHNFVLAAGSRGGAQRAPPCSPYVRTRSIGETRQSVGTAAPDYLWGWLVHPRGESRDASDRINRIGPRPAQPPAT